MFFEVVRLLTPVHIAPGPPSHCFSTRFHRRFPQKIERSISKPRHAIDPVAPRHPSTCSRRRCVSISSTFLSKGQIPFPSLIFAYPSNLHPEYFSAIDMRFPSPCMVSPVCPSLYHYFHGHRRIHHTLVRFPLTCLWFCRFVATKKRLLLKATTTEAEVAPKDDSFRSKFLRKDLGSHHDMAPLK